MTVTTTDWGSAVKTIQDAQTIVVVTHVAPDGDAIGSLLGITNALRSIGKSVDCAVDDRVPESLRFLPGADSIQNTLTGGPWDVMISVDASDEVRTGKAGEYARANSRTIINLDHHATNIMFGDVFLVDPQAVSASEVIYKWLREMQFTLSADVAIPLLTGLVTDTRGFRTSNVKDSTLHIAQQLMAAGASLTEITARALDTKSFNALTLWKHALTTISMHQGGILTAEITQEDLKQARLNDVTDGGLVELLSTVNEAVIAAVFKETSNGEVEVSLRSKPGYDVASVAFSLGGGGHKQASGASIPGTLEEAKARVLPMLKDASRQGKLVIA
jgi:bifunctional oligoribonuclease and PAP phosphatase NrnA